MKCKLKNDSTIYDAKYHKDLTFLESSCAGNPLFSPLDVFVTKMGNGWTYMTKDEVEVVSQSDILTTSEMLLQISEGDRMQDLTADTGVIDDYVQFVNGVLCWGGKKSCPFQVSTQFFKTSLWTKLPPLEKEVPMGEALMAWAYGSTIICKLNGHEDSVFTRNDKPYQKFSDQRDWGINIKKIKHGRWFIKA